MLNLGSMESVSWNVVDFIVDDIPKRKVAVSWLYRYNQLVRSSECSHCAKSDWCSRPTTTRTLLNKEYTC